MFNEINQWLSSRAGKFTASEIHKIMGKGRGQEYFGMVAKSYITTKAAEILTGEPANQRGQTMAMEWGVAHEFEAITKYQAQYGEIEYYGGANPQFFEYSKFSGGSPDGVSGDCVIEVKCPFNSAEHLKHLLMKDREEVKDVIPEYYWQMTANALFTNKPNAVFISYDPRFEDQYQLKVLRFSIDLDDCSLLKERLEEAEKELNSILKRL
jgi:hypothetical protein